MGKKTTLIFPILLFMVLHSPAQETGRLILNDSIITTISTRYESRSFLHRAIMGSNYREAWNMPVQLPVLHFSDAGFTIEKLGGGQQTKSLHLWGKNGRHWVL